ncbi:MAG TPA: Fur family transcriptional regulator [Longimicrobiales bacterium]|nr:Fur family transcriptional regulator [Longimicrobiales bacterium]
MANVHLFRRYLHDQGLPVTQQRELIAEVVFSSSDHLSVEDIEERLRGRGERIGKATIYRTLEMLVKSGLVAEHDFGEGFKRYEHLFGQTPFHGHLICDECGAVTEIQDAELMRLQEKVARERGFRPMRYRLAIYGLCAECAAEGKEVEWQGLTCPIETI